MRTQDEIVAKVQASRSMFGFEQDVWLVCLDFAHAKPFLKAGAKPENWPGKLHTDGEILAEMRDYAEFGWGKIQNHRGLSAGRTVEKMSAWLWLLGTKQADKLIKFADAEKNYPQYGAPILAAICKAYDFPIPDDEAVQRMCKGKPCTDDCQQGCGEE